MPSGASCNKKPPVWIKVAANVFQQIITELFSDLDDAHVNLDDTLVIINGSLLEDGMQKVRVCLDYPENSGFYAYVRISLFAGEQLEYLGF
jgi:hypothetical protein